MRKYWEYVLAALAAIGTFIMYLLGKNRNLKDKVGELQGNEALRESILKKEDAEHEANLKEDNYRAIRNKYLKQSGSSGSDDKS